MRRFRVYKVLARRHRKNRYECEDDRDGHHADPLTNRFAHGDGDQALQHVVEGESPGGDCNDLVAAGTLKRDTKY